MDGRAVILTMVMCLWQQQHGSAGQLPAGRPTDGGRAGGRANTAPAERRSYFFSGLVDRPVDLILWHVGLFAQLEGTDEGKVCGNERAVPCR